MKKILLSVASLAIISTVLSADKQFFAGIDLAYHNSSATISGETYSGSDSESNVYPSIRAGIIDSDYRVYARYDIAYDEKVDGIDMSYDSLDLNMEALHILAPETNLYYGAHIGLGWLAIEGETDNGIQYGVQAGIIQDINQNFSLEFGLRYTIATAGFDITVAGDNAKLEADSVLTASVGANYKF